MEKFTAHPDILRQIAKKNVPFLSFAPWLLFLLNVLQNVLYARYIYYRSFFNSLSYIYFFFFFRITYNLYMSKHNRQLWLLYCVGFCSKLHASCLRFPRFYILLFNWYKNWNAKIIFVIVFFCFCCVCVSKVKVKKIKSKCGKVDLGGDLNCHFNRLISRLVGALCTLRKTTSNCLYRACAEQENFAFDALCVFYVLKNKT